MYSQQITAGLQILEIVSKLGDPRKIFIIYRFFLLFDFIEKFITWGAHFLLQAGSTRRNS